MNFVLNSVSDSATSSNTSAKFLPIQSAPRKYVSDGCPENSSVWHRVEDNGYERMNSIGSANDSSA